MEIFFILLPFLLAIGIPYLSSISPLFGKIVALIVHTIAVGFIGFIAIAVLADSHGDTASSLALGVTVIIWLIGVWRIFGEYLRFGNLKLPIKPTDTKIQIQELTLNEKIEFTDIGSKNSVMLTFHDGSSYKIQLKNLAKMAYEIIRDFQKNDFFPGELENHYRFLKNRYKSTLPPDQYNYLITLLEKFVKEGGRAEVI